METVPTYSPITFGVSVLIALVFIWLSHPKDKIPLMFWLLMGAIGSYLVWEGAQLDNSQLATRLLYVTLPATLLPLLYLFTSRGRRMLHIINDEFLHYTHTLRLAIAFVLLWLHKSQLMPADLTFEGWNYDIIIGLTAPLVAHIGYTQKMLTRNIIIGWNVIGILFLLNIMMHAALSVPGPLHLINHDMPNVAILHFPYQLLPTLVVPILFYCHIVAIVRLLTKEVDVDTEIE